MTDTKHPCTEVLEVPRYEMRRTFVLKPEQYALYQDAMRRLEQTNRKAAIRYKFHDVATAKHYRQYVSGKARKERGLSTVDTLVRRNGTGAYLYVARGEKWGT